MTGDEQAFHDAMLARPEDKPLRLAFSDWLEERGDPRGELARLIQALTGSIDFANRDSLENRIRMLVGKGVQPIGPFVTNALGMRFVWISSGTFAMGSPYTENERFEDERQHEVLLTQGFFFATQLVTQACWRQVMGKNRGHFTGPQLPVDSVSWYDCQEFLQKLGEQDGHRYRLPREAEWEYACRAGTSLPFFFGETISPEQANYDGSFTYASGTEGRFLNRTSLVGSYPPNAWGLFDMHGNLNEWCADVYAEYPEREIVEPSYEEPDGDIYVIRGGSFYSRPTYLRSASRGRMPPGDRDARVGFRLVMSR